MLLLLNEVFVKPNTSELKSKIPKNMLFEKQLSEMRVLTQKFCFHFPFLLLLSPTTLQMLSRFLCHLFFHADQIGL
jgi:hypothetical protein